MRYRLRTLLVILAFPVAAPAFGQDKTDPGEALYGEWEVVEMVYRAKVQDFAGQSGGWFRFQEGAFSRLFFEYEREKLYKPVKYHCIISEREIEIWSMADPKDTAKKALYDFKDGKLRIIWGEDGYLGRPADFNAMKDRRLVLFVLKKVK